MTPVEHIRDRSRKVDQLASMYSTLRDRYAFRATVLQILIIASSFLLFGLSIASDRLLRRVGLDPEGARDTVALLAGVVILAAIIDLRLDYRGRAALLNEGANRLYELKGVLREAIAIDEVAASQSQTLRDQDATVMKLLPGLPEGQFLPLKAAHMRKRRLSALVSRHPGTPLWLLRFRLWIDGISRWPSLDPAAIPREPLAGAAVSGSRESPDALVDLDAGEGSRTGPIEQPL